MDHMGAIDPARCRASVAERHDIAVTAISDELVYRRAVGVQATLAPHRAATPTLRSRRGEMTVDAQHRARSWAERQSSWARIGPFLLPQP